MASAQVYQHKKFDLKTQQYNHKKFGNRLNKRKREEMEDNEIVIPITAYTILEQSAKGAQQQPLPKRKQMKSLFRPWLDDGKKNKSMKLEKTTNVLTYKPIKAHQQPKHLLISQQQQLMLQQQYAFYRQYQAALMQRNMATAFYMKRLQQLDLQRKRQQQFVVFGQQ